MSNNEARGLLETMERVLAACGYPALGECALSIADWISGRPMEGEAGGECDRGDKRVMEYCFLVDFYLAEMGLSIQGLASRGWKAHSPIFCNGQFVVMMERERAEGT